MEYIFHCEKCGAHKVTETRFNSCVTEEIRERLKKKIEQGFTHAHARFGDNKNCPDCKKFLNTNVRVTVSKEK